MNKAIIISIAILGLGAAIWVAKPGSAAPDVPVLGAPGQLQASETKFDFGTITMKNGKVSREVTVTNNGTGPATIGKLFTSCMCTTSALEVNGEKYGPFGMQGHGYIPRIGAQLGAGQTARMTITFDPNAHGPAGVGHIERTVTLEYGEKETLDVDFSADVTP